MTKIETVIFDSGGVLHANNNAVSADIKNELGLDDETLRQIWAEQIPLLGSGAIDEAEFWRQVEERHGIRHVSPDENLLGRAFAENLVPFEDVAQVVKELGLLGITTAVLSNTIEPHARALRDAKIYDVVNGPVLLSHEIGLRKPGEEIYRYALDRLGSEPYATIFVDDDPKNADAASALGIRGIVFKNTDQLRADLGEYIAELRQD